MSHWYLRDNPAAIESLLSYQAHNKIRLFIDSGAITAYNKSTVVDLKIYIDFCKKYYNKAWGFIALDVLRNKEKTFENLKIMIDNGLTPFPVITTDTTTDEAINININGIIGLHNIHPFQRICMAGATQNTDFADKKIRIINEKLKKVFCDKYNQEHPGSSIPPEALIHYGANLPKFHALGYSEYPRLLSSPATSFDSSSWAYGQRYAVLYVLTPGGGMRLSTRLKLPLSETSRLGISASALSHWWKGHPASAPHVITWHTFYRSSILAESRNKLLFHAICTYQQAQQFFILEDVIREFGRPDIKELNKRIVSQKEENRLRPDKGYRIL